MNDTTKPSRLPRALRPFAVGQYRLLTSALVCSMLSIGIWLVASVWQVIQLGGTPTDLSASPSERSSAWCCPCSSVARWPTGSRSGSSC